MVLQIVSTHSFDFEAAGHGEDHFAESSQEGVRGAAREGEGETTRPSSRGDTPGSNSRHRSSGGSIYTDSGCSDITPAKTPDRVARVRIREPMSAGTVRDPERGTPAGNLKPALRLKNHVTNEDTTGGVGKGTDMGPADQAKSHQSHHDPHQHSASLQSERSRWSTESLRYPSSLRHSQNFQIGGEPAMHPCIAQCYLFFLVAMKKASTRIAALEQLINIFGMTRHRETKH